MQESVQNPETVDAQKVSASAYKYDVFCMLEDALDPSLAGGHSLRASLAPSQSWWIVFSPLGLDFHSGVMSQSCHRVY